jgi:dGTP triphosphohydrolase
MHSSYQGRGVSHTSLLSRNPSNSTKHQQSPTQPQQETASVSITTPPTTTTATQSQEQQPPPQQEVILPISQKIDLYTPIKQYLDTNVKGILLEILSMQKTNSIEQIQQVLDKRALDDKETNNIQQSFALLTNKVTDMINELANVKSQLNALQLAQEQSMNKLNTISENATNVNEDTKNVTIQCLNDQLSKLNEAHSIVQQDIKSVTIQCVNETIKHELNTAFDTKVNEFIQKLLNSF